MAGSDADLKELQVNCRKVLSSSKDPLEKLRCQCLLRGYNGILGFGRQFRIMDDDGSKALSKEEFSKGCKDFGCNLTPEESDELFKRLDRDGSGNIIFDEFLRALRIDDLRRVYQVKSHPKYQSGKMSEDQILTEYVKSFEVGGNLDGKVTWDEFLDYYSGLSASIDSDSYFELMMWKAFAL